MHNISTGWRDYLRYGRPVIIPGMELSTFFGHMVLVDFLGDSKWHELGRDSRLEDVVRRVNDQGGLFSVAHPYTIGDPICTGCRWMYDNFAWETADMLEVWNGCWGLRRIEIMKSIEKWEHLLNRGLKVIPVSGSDLHDFGDFDRDSFAYTYVRSRGRDAQSILSGLRQGRVFISRGPKVSFGLKSEVNQTEALPGDEIEVPAGTGVSLSLAVDEECGVRVFKNGEEISCEWLSPRQPAEVKDRVESGCWYYVRMYDGRGELLGITNAVFVREP